MKISDLLKKELIIPELSGDDKMEVINRLVDLFEGDERVSDLEKVREAVIEREKIMSTGVGKGFAIPHGKTDAVTDVLCAFGRMAEPIDYQAQDDKPVKLIFLLVGKEEAVSLHIKLLSRISRMMTLDEFRKKLCEADSADEILAIFKEEEESYFDIT